MSEKSLFFQGGLQQVINLSLAVVPNQEWGQSPPAFHPVAFRNVWRPFFVGTYHHALLEVLRPWSGQ